MIRKIKRTYASIVMLFFIVNSLSPSFALAERDGSRDKKNDINLSEKYRGPKLEKVRNAMKKTNEYQLLIESSGTKDELIQKFSSGGTVSAKIRQIGDHLYLIKLPRGRGDFTPEFQKIDNGIVPSEIAGYSVIEPEVFEAFEQSASLSGESIEQLWWMNELDLLGDISNFSLGEKIQVGVLDTGIDPGHPDISENLDTTLSYDFIHASSGAIDDNGHGTEVAGVIGARLNGLGIFGIDPDASLVSLKVLDVNGLGSSYDVLEALTYAKDHHIPVINLSFGGLIGNPATSPICQSISDLKNNGTITVVAAGNSNQEVLNTLPAACPDAFTVGAKGRDGFKAPFSNYGTLVDLYAPGVDILSTTQGGGYSLKNGTSFAAPIITGLIARALKQHPTKTQSQIIDEVSTQTGISLTFQSLPTNSGSLSNSGTTESGSSLSGTAQVGSSIDYSNYYYYSGTFQRGGVLYGNSFYSGILDLTPGEKNLVTVYSRNEYEQILANQSQQFHIHSVQPNGLISEWQLNGNADDTSGNGFHGTAFDMSYAASGTGGYTNQVGVFSGTSYINVANDIDIGSGMSWSFWTYIDSWAPDAAFISKRDGGANSAFQIGMEGPNLENGKLLLYLWNPGFGNTNSNNGFLELGKWLHVLVTFDGSSVKYYKNAVLDSTSTDIGGISTTTLATHLGDDWFNHKFKGKIRSFRVFNRALTGSEIIDIYNDTLPSTVSNVTNTPNVNQTFETNTGLTYDPKSGPNNFPFTSNAFLKKLGSSPGISLTNTEKEGDPINLATGEFAYDNTLMALPGVGQNYELKVMYKNQADYNGPLGFNWDYNYNQYLSGETNGNVLYNNGSLGTFRFLASGTGYLRNEGLRANLILSGGLYTIAYEDGRRTEFDSSNRLRYLRDRNGNTLSFGYSGGYLSGVTDTLGRTIRYTYYDHNRLASVIEPGGRRVDFLYLTGSTNSGNLYDLASITLVNATGATRTVGYEYSTGATGVLKHNLLRLIDAKGQVYVSNTYNSDDRVAAQQYGSGTLTYTYTLSGTSITKNTVIDRLGYKTEYNYDSNGNTTSTLYYNAAQTGSLTYTFEYNTGGLLTKERRPSGFGYICTYDGSGNLLQKEFKVNVDIPTGSGKIHTYRYNTKNELIKEINPVGRTILYARDSSGNLLTKTLTGATTYSLTGAATSTRNLITTYVYTSGGLLSRETSPEGRIKNYKYLSGLLMTFSYGSGSETSTGSYTYTPYGLPLTHTDGDGYTESWTYSPFDEVESHTSPLGIATNYTYDANGNLLSQGIDMGSGITADTNYTYDILDKPLTETRETSEGNVVTTTYVYDLAGNITSKKVGDAAEIRYSYNEFSLPVEERIIMTPGNPADDIVTSFEYDSNNLISKKIDPRGNIITYTNNVFFNTPSSIRYPDSFVNTISYYLDGVKQDDHVSASGTFQDGKLINYDGYQHPIYMKVYSGSSFLSGGLVSKYFYDKDDNLVATIDQRGLTGSLTYNSRGLLSSEKDRMNNVTSYTYNKRGKVLTKTLTPVIGSGMTTTYYYDADGNMTGTLDNSGGLQSFSYNRLSLLTRSIDEMGRITDIARDYRGLPLAETEYLSGSAVTTYRSYDSRGNLTSITDPRNNTTTYEYDGKNRLKKTIYPDLTFSTTTYDKSDNIATFQDPNGTLSTHSYDNRDRRISTVINRASGVLGFTGITYEYDLFGNPSRISDSNSGVITYAYDKFARLTSETQKLPGTGATTTISYTYDNNSNLLTRKYPDNRNLTYTYDALDRPLSVSFSGVSLATYGYSGVLRSAVNLANSAKIRYTYDKLYRLSTLSGVSMILPKITLTYDKSGLITSDSRRNYSYDSLLRLTSATPGSGTGNTLSGSIEAFAYDLAGNRTTSTRNFSGSTYTTNTLDEYTSITGSILSGSILSDANGNIIQDSTRKYSYDAMNHLIEVRSLSGNTLIASYTYDGLGRRTTKYIPNTTSTGLTLPTLSRTTTYISSGDTPLQEVITNGSGAKVNQLFIFLGKGEDEVIAYDYASGSSMTGTRYYPITDHLGSVIGIVNASRTLMERYIYDAYGKPYRVYGIGSGIGNGTLTIQSMDSRDTTSTGSTYGNTRLYTGRYYDREVGLSYHRARYYDPQTGRFTGRDPIGQRDQVNLFMYVKNSPLIFVDRTGLAKAIIMVGGHHLLFGKPINDVLNQVYEIQRQKFIDMGYKPENIVKKEVANIDEFKSALVGNNYKDIAFVGHGDRDKIRLTYDGNPETEFITAKNVNQLPIINDKNVTFTINACLAGAGDDSISGDVAKQMGVSVKAPDSIIKPINGELISGGDISPNQSKAKYIFNQIKSIFPKKKHHLILIN